MKGALSELSEIKLLVSEHIVEGVMVAGPKTCAKLQQWFGAAKTLRLVAQPITTAKTTPEEPASPDGEITGVKTIKFAGQCKHGIPIGQTCLLCSRR